MNVRGGKGTIRWSPHTLPRLSNARGGGGKICRPLGAIPHLSNSGGHFVPPQYNNPLLWNVRGEGDCISLHRRRVVALSLSSSSSRRVIASRERSIVVLTQQILPATHLIANSGDDTARSTICVMPSRRQNRRLEKTARLILLLRVPAGGGALKWGLTEMAIAVSPWSVYFSFLFSLFEF